MILILTSPEDAHADAVEPHLRDAGAGWLRLDPGRFPAAVTVSVRLRGAGLDRHLTVDGVTHDLSEVGAVWTRRPGRPTAASRLGAGPIGDLVVAESEAFLDDLWETLEVRHVPAPRAVLRRAGLKLRQLQLAARLGFTVPDTAGGNDPGSLLTLYEQHPMVVTKRVTSGHLGVTLDGTATAGRPTRPVRPRDLLHAEDLRLCPVLTQGYAAKRLELRVTVVGDRVFAAAIDSQRSARTRFDWRAYDQRVTPMAAYDLPPVVAERCRRLVRMLGLGFGALDLVLTPDGDHVFLELNPNGQYLWTEQESGLPISAAVAQLLLDADRPRPAIVPRTAVPA